MMLHTINIIILNYRLKTTGTDISDAEFLGKILDSGLDVMEAHIRRNWDKWNDMLARTLLEWKLNYKIENRLTPRLVKLVSEKEKESLNLKDMHYTLLEQSDGLSTYLKTYNSENITTALNRIWAMTNRNPEPNRDPYNKFTCTYSSGEGWNMLTTLTQKYLTPLLANPNTRPLVFRNIGSDKLALIPQNFVMHHAATFIESASGASIRVLIGLLQSYNASELVKTDAFKNCITELMSFLKYTLQNLHTLSPYLSKYLFELCEYITKMKGSPDYWDEINGLLILRLLAPAVCNPVPAGIVEYAGLDAVKLLTLTAKIIQHGWAGKPIETGELSNLKWLNDEIPKWKEELKKSFDCMLNSRRAEPRDIYLPKTLLLHDLLNIKEYMKGFEWTKCPGTSLPVSKKLTSHKKQKIEVEEEIPEEINVEEDVSDFKPRRLNREVSFSPRNAHLSVDTHTSRYKLDELEESTPSMGSLPPTFGNVTQIEHSAPPDIFLSKKKIEIIKEYTSNNEHKVIIEKDSDEEDIRLGSPIPESVYSENQDLNLRSKSTQTKFSSNHTKMLQTEIVQTNTKNLQTDTAFNNSISIQTDPERKRFKMRSRLENTILIMDQETTTDLDIKSLLEQQDKMRKELEILTKYQEEETIRHQGIHKYWSKQFSEMKDENTTLKKQLKQLQQQLNEAKEQIQPEQNIQRSFSHQMLRNELESRYLVQDQEVLRMCDPHHYLSIESTSPISRREPSTNLLGSYGEELKDKVREALSIHKNYRRS